MTDSRLKNVIKPKFSVSLQKSFRIISFSGKGYNVDKILFDGIVNIFSVIYGNH